MRRSLSKFPMLLALLFVFSCSDDAAEERREFQQLEAAIGMVANANPQDRGIRLEQLEVISVRFDRIANLKRICVSSYKAFENVAQLLNDAKKSTAAAEAKVAEADRKKSDGGTLSKAEETEIIEMGKRAATSLKTMTKELDSAEKLVTACQEERNRLRFQMAAP